MPRISIVIPVYNEAASLPELARRIIKALRHTPHNFETWLVDDGSTDASWDVIEKIHEADERFAGLRLRRNYGKSAALAVGFEHVQGEYVVTLDADLQDDPEEIPEMIAMLQEGYDLVSGWKQNRKDRFVKRSTSKFFNATTRALTGIDLHDFNCGLKAYRVEVVKSVKIYGELHRYIPVLAKWEGYGRIAERPVLHHARKHGTTKFGIERFVRGFLDLISVSFLTRFAVRPMHFFGAIGTVAFFFGLLIDLWIAIDKIVFGHPIGDRPALLLGALLIVFGVQMFTTGLLGEMIIRPEMEDTRSYKIGSVLEPGLGSPVNEATRRTEASTSEKYGRR